MVSDNKTTNRPAHYEPLYRKEVNRLLFVLEMDIVDDGYLDMIEVRVRKKRCTTPKLRKEKAP
jgi:hypothetical protein